MRGLIVRLLAAMALLLPGYAQAQPSAPSAPISYAGKTVLVTGSTEGLGRSLALALAAQGANVIVHGRNAEGGQSLVDEIKAMGKGSAAFYPADFSSLATVREFADTIARTYPKLDLLVNNAGVAVAATAPRRVSNDGHELQFQVNYLAGWILANRLRPNLAAGKPSRVINISSSTASAINWDDVMLEQPGAARRGYGQSKLAQVTMTVALAPSFARDGITMIAVHPEDMMNTAMVTRDLGRPARTTVEQGRDHVMSLITAPTLEAGAYYVQGKVTEPYNPQPKDPAAREKLIKLSTDLTGVAATGL
jgi:NAD(P)-dependent dehydrogenase (short-subunit alcohol dehydrogenase family)